MIFINLFTIYTYFKKRCRREQRMAVVEWKLHDRKELWFLYLVCKNNEFFALDGNKNPTNLHIWQWKTVFLHALHVHFSSFDILKTLSFFLWREMTCFAVVWTTWAYDDKCSILSCPERWFQFNSWIVKAHFSGIMTLNNWKMIAETRSDIFRWRYRFRRRRVCLSSLLILPYARPTGSGFTWQTMTHHRRSALYGAGIMGAYFLLIFNTHISFQSCNRRSTIDIRRSPRQHFLK